LAASPADAGCPPRPRRLGRRWLRHTLIVAALCLAAFLVVLLYRSAGTSFAFIWSATGWDISLTFLPYTVSDPYWWAFLVGLTNTVVAGALGIVSATLIGFAIGSAPLAQNAMLTGISRLYVDVIRNIPLILQAIFWYGVILHLPPVRSSLSVFNSVFVASRGVFIPGFANTHLVIAAILLLIAAAIAGVTVARSIGRVSSKKEWLVRSVACAVLLLSIAALVPMVPQLPAAVRIEWPTLVGLNFRGGISLTPEFAALIMAVTIYRGAFMGEIFRGGFMSTSRGHIDAAKSLGLKPLQTLWTVRLPIALVHILPPLSNEYINIIKVTAIGIIIGFPDLFWVSSNASMQTGRPLQVIAIMVALYLILNFSVAAVMNAVNRRVRARGFL
jgi:general L-amino acid transport system permease protein